MEKDVIIVTNLSIFKEESASYSRIVSYAKALENEGINFYITDASINTPIEKKNFRKITNNLFILNNKEQDKISNIFYDNFNLIKIIKYIKRIKKFIRSKETSDTELLVYTYTFILNFFILLFAKINGIKTVCEKNEISIGIILNLEFPIGFFKKVLFFPYWVLSLLIAILTDITDFFYDNIIVISTRLEKLYKIFKKKSVRIPALFFDISNNLTDYNKKNNSVFNIGYFGTIGRKKDNVFLMLETISKLVENGYKVKLNIYGFINKSSLIRLNKYIKRYKLENNVSYEGAIPHSEIQLKMRCQDLLVLIRDSNLQNNYGFSTKLAEYLFSGVPTLMTDISDNRMFITNTKDGFIIKPNDKEALLNILSDIVSGKYDFKKIGEEGYKTALKNFNPYLYKKDLREIFC